MTLKSSWAEWWLRSFLFLLSLLPVFHTSAADREAKELRLGYFPNITHAQALYARATGEFEKKQACKSNGPPSTPAPPPSNLFTDAVDATFVGPSPTINGYIKSRGEKFVIVSGRPAWRRPYRAKRFGH
jgi:NitT/TauT family transport system substrate-binding protein